MPFKGLILAILVAPVLAGCTGSDTETYHIEGVQCESMPWDGEEYGGSDEIQLQRMRDHYEARGVDIVGASMVPVRDGVTAVCGAPRGDAFQVTVRGPFPMAEADGWSKGPAEPADGQ